MIRNVWTVDEMAAILRGLALSCGLEGDRRAGFAQALASVATALGLNVAPKRTNDLGVALRITANSDILAGSRET
ncbi:MAG: hypothetical protein M0R06_21995 [Sphaerochaeta sp.]|jgi:hypothetical protein|nr:hypothetical protein [Sphaerochaeta sp.]